MEITTNKLDETKEFAARVVSGLKPKEGGATILALYGDLGSGKTSFTQGLAAAFGLCETIASPTFVIEKIYELEHQIFKRLIHIDAYRLDGGEDLVKLGFEDIAADPDNLIVIEWPERVKDILPATASALTFTFIDDNTRTIKYD